MKIAICDDNPTDLNMMDDYCKRYDPSLHVNSFTSSKELLEAFLSNHYDLVFLDIEMDPPNGYDTALELRSKARKPEIIFTTKNLNYSIRGYGVALRYLPKPISYDIFAQALHQALLVISPRRVTIPYQGTQKVVQISDIMYIEVLRHQVAFHMANALKLEFRGTLKEVMAQINSPWFVQCHKSYCVNLNYIDRTTFQSIILVNEEVIPIGRNKKEGFEERLQEFLKGSIT